MPNRIEKVNDLIRDNLSKIIKKELSLKSGVFVTITKVDTSKDLRYSHVFISVYPENEREYAEKTLQKEIHRIQGKLNKTLSMKIFPKIEFRSDQSQKQVGELDQLFEQIKREKGE
jgi:ribosome-binding factor A